MCEFARSGLNFVYPPTCVFCLAEVNEEASLKNGGTCSNCHQALTRSHGRSCLLCGAAIGPFLDPSGGCQYCCRDKFAFEQVIRLGVYDAELRAACLRSKQRGFAPVAAGLAGLLWSFESPSLTKATIDLIVPIPQFWLQSWFRPHNTADVIATILSRRLHLPMKNHVLKKIRWTPPQSRLTPTQRRTNLRNAFAATRAQSLAGATVLLVDDVMTTGTTAHEAAKVLRKAGAKHVLLAVIARGLGRRGV